MVVAVADVVCVAPFMTRAATFGGADGVRVRPWTTGSAVVATGKLIVPVDLRRCCDGEPGLRMPLNGSATLYMGAPDCVSCC